MGREYRSPRAPQAEAGAPPRAGTRRAALLAAVAAAAGVLLRLELLAEVLDASGDVAVAAARLHVALVGGDRLLEVVDLLSRVEVAEREERRRVVALQRPRLLERDDGVLLVAVLLDER